MNSHTALILAGLALGAYAGYRWAGSFQTYPVYRQLDLFIRQRGGAIGGGVYRDPSLGERIDEAGNTIGNVVDVVGNALDTLDRIFGDDYNDVQQLYASSGQY